MDPSLFGPGSFLGNILGLGGSGGVGAGSPASAANPTTFGSLGSQPAPAPMASAAPVPSDPTTLGPGAQPAPGAPGVGAPMDISAQGPGNAGPGLWSQIAGKLGIGQGGNPALKSLADNVGKQGQPKIIQTPGFQWLTPAGPR